MKHRFDDREVTSVSDLLTYLKEDYEAVSADPLNKPPHGNPVIWYRGLPSRNLTLLPTLYRGNTQASERNLMNKFKQNAYQFLNERPQGEWEWLLLARHHGLPSRNYLTGLKTLPLACFSVVMKVNSAMQAKPASCGAYCLRNLTNLQT